MNILCSLVKSPTLCYYFFCLFSRTLHCLLLVYSFIYTSCTFPFWQYLFIPHLPPHPSHTTISINEYGHTHRSLTLNLPYQALPEWLFQSRVGIDSVHFLLCTRRPSARGVRLTFPHFRGSSSFGLWHKPLRYQGWTLTFTPEFSTHRLNKIFMTRCSTTRKTGTEGR